MNVDRFLIRDDEVQVDKAIYFMRYRLQKLLAENKGLTQENQQFKNRPDTIYDPSEKGLVVKRTKGGVNMDDSIEQWNTRHFLRLFQDLYAAKYPPQKFNIKGKQWEVFSIRLSQFQRARKEIHDNATYRDMIKWLFAKKFNKKFIASIALISCDAMLDQWLVSTKSLSQTSPEKFKQLAARIPKSTKALDKAVEEAF